MKTCRRCGEAKPLEEFYRHNSCADGRASKCKVCIRAYDQARYRTNVCDAEWSKRHRKRTRDGLRKLRKDPAYQERKRAWTKGRPRPSTLESVVRQHAKNAIRGGRLILAEVCERCSHDFTEFRREMHHADYSKPLEIESLCSRCHGKEHRKKDVA